MSATTSSPPPPPPPPPAAAAAAAAATTTTTTATSPLKYENAGILLTRGIDNIRDAFLHRDNEATALLRERDHRIALLDMNMNRIKTEMIQLRESNEELLNEVTQLRSFKRRIIGVVGENALGSAAAAANDDDDDRRQSVGLSSPSTNDIYHHHHHRMSIPSRSTGDKKMELEDLMNDDGNGSLFRNNGVRQDGSSGDGGGIINSSIPLNNSSRLYDSGNASKETSIKKDISSALAFMEDIHNSPPYMSSSPRFRNASLSSLSPQRHERIDTSSSSSPHRIVASSSSTSSPPASIVRKTNYGTHGSPPPMSPSARMKADLAMHMSNVHHHNSINEDLKHVPLTSPSMIESSKSSDEGRAFFRDARIEMKPDMFALFLKQLHSLHSHHNSRKDTLDKARRLFGKQYPQLYQRYAALVAKPDFH